MDVTFYNIIVTDEKTDCPAWTVSWVPWSAFDQFKCDFLAENELNIWSSMVVAYNMANSGSTYIVKKRPQIKYLARKLNILPAN